MLQAPVLALSPRPRRARRPRSVQRHAAARPRSVGRGRRGAGGRHAAAHPVPAMGRRSRAARSSASMPIRKEHNRLHKPAVALTGDAAPILQSLLAELPKHNAKRASRKAEMQERQAAWRKRFEQARAADRLSRSDPRRTARGRHFRRRRHADRLCRAPRLSGLQAAHLPLARLTRTISAGALPPRSARSMRGPTCRWWRSPATAASCSPPTRWRPRCATAFRWSTIVFNDGAFGNVRRIQQERFGNRLIGSDLANPDFVAFAKSFGAEAVRANDPDELRARAAARLCPPRRPHPHRSSGRRPAEPWEFIHMRENVAVRIARCCSTSRGLATPAAPEPHCRHDHGD